MLCLGCYEINGWNEISFDEFNWSANGEFLIYDLTMF